MTCIALTAVTVYLIAAVGVITGIFVAALCLAASGRARHQPPREYRWPKEWQ